MVVGFITTYAISAYHHWCFEFESRSGRGLQQYVIKWHATGWWFSLCRSVSSTNKTDCHDITEILLKVVFTKQTNKHIFVPSQDLDLWCHMSLFFLCSVSSVKMRGVVCFVDIDGIDVHQCRSFLFVSNPPLLPWKSGLIREVASLERDNLVVVPGILLSQCIWNLAR
jgi:hypothetical protein